MDAYYSARKLTKLAPYNSMGRTGYTTNRGTVRGTNNKLSTHDEVNDKQLQVYCLKNPSSVSEFR